LLHRVSRSCKAVPPVDPNWTQIAKVVIYPGHNLGPGKVDPRFEWEAPMPRLRLTEQMIQAARKPGELWDTDVPGLFLRVQARKKTWAFGMCS
jgi:hypothetical protein